MSYEYNTSYSTSDDTANGHRLVRISYTVDLFHAFLDGDYV